jgi:hypothetical protein
MSLHSDPTSLIRHAAFRQEPAQGALRRLSGERVTLLTREAVHALHATLVEQFSETAVDVLYRSGYEWGLQEILVRQQRLKAEVGGTDFDFWQMDAKFVLDAWWMPFAEAGWGHCAFQRLSHPRNLYLIDLRSSLVAATLRPAEEPVCHLYAGLFAGAVSFFDRQERHGAELQCAAVRGDLCRFLVGSGPDIDAAESLRQQGVTTDEILARLV